MPKRPPMEIEFVASPRADAEEKHKALLALLARGVVEGEPPKHSPHLGVSPSPASRRDRA